MEQQRLPASSFYSETFRSHGPGDRQHYPELCILHSSLFHTFTLVKKRQ